MALHINADVVNIEHQVVQPPAPPLPAVQAPGELPHAAPQPAHADGAQERDQLRERVAELEEELAAAHQQVNEQAANIAGLQHRIVALQREVAERNRRIGNLQRRVNAQDHEIMDLRRRVNARDHEIMDLRQDGKTYAYTTLHVGHTRFSGHWVQKSHLTYLTREMGSATQPEMVAMTSHTTSAYGKMGFHMK
ncbi:hypothetical protein EV363DRAFT_702565 [Boletus edulis]|nr:hypothetical protein EV363DRAFT_702565 [Boletus edulis]